MDAVKIYEEAARKVGRGEINLMEFWKLIRPLRDVEAVVRCRDCKKAEHDKIFRGYWCRGREIDPDGYCSDGERKDGAAMDKLNNAIASTAYILDCLRSLKSIYETGDCNNCGIEPTCKFKPVPGQMVRYNCPFYVKDGDGNG